MVFYSKKKPGNLKAEITGFLKIIFILLSNSQHHQQI